MAGSNLLTTNNQLSTSPIAPSAPTSLSKTWYGSIYSAALDAPVGYKTYLRADKAKQSRDIIEEITGQKANQIIKIDEAKYPNPTPEGRIKAYDEAYDNYVIEQRKKDARFNRVKTNQELDSEITSEAKFTREFIAKQVQGEGFAGAAVSFSGSVAGSFTDPINAATMFVGFGSAKTLLQAASREAALNIGVEAIQIPQRAEWEKRLGYKYGLKEASADILTAGIAGAGFAALGRGASKLIDYTKRKATGLEVFTDISLSKETPSEVREAATYMGRAAHIDENNPVINPTRDDVLTHRQNVIEAESAIKENRPPNIGNEDRFIIQARDIKKQISTDIVDVNKPKEVAKIIGRTPESLSQFIKRIGGIQDVSGELKSRDIGKKSVGLIAKNKRTQQTAQGVIEIDNTIDAVKQQVYDAGYFPNKTDYNEISDSELFDAIDSDVYGKKVYTQDDLNAISDYIGQSDLANRYDEIGITSDMSEDEIADVLRNISDPADDLIITPKNSSATFEEHQALFEDAGYMDSVEADFERMLKENPDDIVDFDGEEMTISEINEIFRENQDILDAVRVCAVG